MKSLRVFVCILVLTCSVFGSFILPEKSFAAVTKDQFDNIRQSQFNINVVEYFDSIIPVVPNDFRQEVWRVLRASGDKIYESSIKDNQATTPTEAYVLLLTQWEQDLGNVKAGPSTFLGITIGDGTDVAVKRMIASMKNSKERFSAQLRFEKGQITQKEADALKSASQQAFSSSVGSTLPSERTDTCSFVPMRLTPCITEGVTWLIKNVFLNIAGFLLWVTANILNQAVIIGILNFKDWAPDTLYPIWIIVRQILSLLIVFAGLYLGFLYIVGDKEEKFARYIPWVVVFALFVNFSYPLARTAVDVSNIVSLKIYAAALGNEVLTSSATSASNAGSIIVNRLGLQGLIVASVDTVSTGSNIIGSIDSLPGSLITVAYVLYAAYIFFMASMILITRTAALSFIIIVSPFLLIESVVPFLGEHAVRLRKIFIEQLAAGPVFMILLALTLKFLEVFSVNGPLSAGVGGSSTIVTFFNILMMLIMLHITITVTKKAAGEIGNAGSKMIGAVGGASLGLATGGMAFAGRKAIGGMAMKARESGWIRNNQDSFIGRKMYDMSNSLSKSTFDLRNSKV